MSESDTYIPLIPCPFLTPKMFEKASPFIVLTMIGPKDAAKKNNHLLRVWGVEDSAEEAQKINEQLEKRYPSHFFGIVEIEK